MAQDIYLIGKVWISQGRIRFVLSSASSAPTIGVKEHFQT
jgi:hypothetical protein